MDRDSRRLLVRGGTVVAGRRLRRVDVMVRGGVVVEVAARLAAGAGTAVLDADGCLVAPGFIDLQLNGAFGHDLTTSPGSVTEVAARLPRTGVTAWCPTVVSCSTARRERALATLGAARHGPRATVGAQVLGVHLEGPFLAPSRRGAHPPGALVAPDPAQAAPWSRAGGVAVVTIAPELPGALDVVRGLVARGVLVSAGHSDATAEQFAVGVEAGVRYVTHLFNAMRPFAHRDPGIVGAALTDERVTCGLIADGVHLDPTTVRLAWRALGPERTSLVTDAVAPLGTADGRARVGDVELVVTDHGVREPGGALAGTNLSLDAAVRNLRAWTGCSVVDALATVTTVPARLLGLDGRGEVRTGAAGDLVVLDRGLRVLTTVVGGRSANMSG